MTGDNSGDDLVQALTNAALTLAAIYEWADRVEAAGGTTCMEGVAAAHAMMKSLKRNRSRMETLVLGPARRALKAAGAQPAEPVGSRENPRPAQKTRPTRGRRPGTKSVVDEAR